MCVCVHVCVCVCVFVRVRGWAGACAGGVRFSNSNRIIPSDYRILLLLKMPIPKINVYCVFQFNDDLTMMVISVCVNEAVLLQYLLIIKSSL